MTDINALVKRLTEEAAFYDDETSDHSTSSACRDAITVITAQSQEIERLRVLLRDVTSDLEAEVNHRYGETKTHPAMAKDYEVDIASVREAQAVLAGTAGQSLPAPPAQEDGSC